MTREQADNEARRYKKYFPFRLVGIAGKDGVWSVLIGKNKARFNSAVRDGFEVYILG